MSGQRTITDEATAGVTAESVTAGHGTRVAAGRSTGPRGGPCPARPVARRKPVTYSARNNPS
ncbi:hypothetical protein ACF07S_10785 [Streptomyces sp. NPDC016640]|uniref:hypothetical protein n=1 Tax=Streptomyces sp. NPDC016640 TaxID=3364969 RepID=UPI0036FD85CE